MEKININYIIKEYDSYLNYLKTQLLEDIDNKDKELIITDGKTEKTLTLGNMITLLLMIKPFEITGEEIELSKLPLDLKNIDSYDDYFNYLLEHFRDNKKIDIKDSLINYIITELSKISGSVNYNYGSTISIKSIIDLKKKNKRFNELLNFKIKEGDILEFDEIGEIMKKNLKEVIEILKNSDNCLRQYLLSGAGINEKQLGQVLSYIGPKPNLEGKIIPYPVNTSFLRGLGLRDYYINAKGARKAIKLVLHTVMYVENFFNCWKTKLYI